MALFDDNPGKPIQAYEIGQDLSMLSLSELEDAIARLRAEIARLETEIETKDTSRIAAERLFRRR